ncbi:hypothetical protein Pan241w_52950 [Gimesia alba]|uniref:Uncharacterized protein n=1 Tax=Gimesia alba TaxID=2527973 RepID=A0A517RMS3_9PLAN|nr:hypothetical protein Pan241w_52950 [Gimesia alba]
MNIVNVSKTDCFVDRQIPCNKGGEEPFRLGPAEIAPGDRTGRFALFPVIDQINLMSIVVRWVARVATLAIIGGIAVWNDRPMVGKPV